MTELKVPWLSISEYPTDHGAAITREALREIGAGHPLAGRKLTMLARRQDCDDVLFLLDDGPNVAVVHLTWSGRRERRGFPTADIFSDLSEFVGGRMEADRIEFGEN